MDSTALLTVLSAALGNIVRTVQPLRWRDCRMGSVCIAALPAPETAPHLRREYHAHLTAVQNIDPFAFFLLAFEAHNITFHLYWSLENPSRSASNRNRTIP